MSKKEVLYEIWPKAGRVGCLFSVQSFLLLLILICIFALEPGDRVKHSRLDEGGVLFYRALWSVGFILIASQLVFLLRNWFGQLAIIFTEDAITFESNRSKKVIPFDDVKEMRVYSRRRFRKGHFVYDLRCIDKNGKRVSPRKSTLGANQDKDVLMRLLEKIRKKYPHIEIKEPFDWF
jgi:hypothetical protein